MKYKHINIYIVTLIKLGLFNIFFVFIYRTLKFLGFYYLIAPIHKCPIPEVQNTKEIKKINSSSEFIKCINKANEIIDGKFVFFDHNSFFLGFPPNWFLDPYKNYIFSRNKLVHWSKIKTLGNVDIKNIWELSRWSWAPLLARVWKVTGDNIYLDTLNNIIKSWCESNPVNKGPNWSCGQEVSIRLIHSLQAWQIIDSDSNEIPINSLNRVLFINEHIQRILLTHKYAQAQENNHWISEAAALFIGGAWLKDSLITNKGRISLEAAVKRLIMNDGSFSQHSINYHRLLLDTLNQVEIWRKRLNLKDFSSSFYFKVRLAINWFNSFIDKTNGDAPNLGGNDGAYCYQMHSLDYRDFRPTLQLCCILFETDLAPSTGAWNHQLDFINENIFLKNQSIKNKSVDDSIILFPKGGYYILRMNSLSWGLLRLPIYRFRPTNLDFLHFDLWFNGINILRDGGTFSYNCDSSILDYFQGIQSHNSVEFDKKQPMPRFGRFLFGNSIKLDFIEQLDNAKDNLSIACSYVCPFGQHMRRIQMDVQKHEWSVQDDLSSFKQFAIIRWHLCDSNWVLSGNYLISDIAVIKVSSLSSADCKIRLSKSLESKYYNNFKENPVLLIEMNQSPMSIRTDIKMIKSTSPII